MSVESRRTARVTLHEAYRFYVPLLLMAELMMISHAVITAFLARMSDPEPVLAAYSIAFYFHATLGSPVWAMQIIAISFARDRLSMRRLLVFSIQTAVLTGWIWALVGLTPFGTWFFQAFFGASPEVAEEARRCVVVSSLIIPCVVLRSLSYALLMVERRTVLVTLGTVVRLVGLAGLLALLTLWTEGAVVGMAALAGCIAIETVYSTLVARRFYRNLPARSENVPTYGALWRFSWPIMLMHVAESGVAFTVNFFLGRLVRPELALAAFGVVDSLVRVLLGPLRNLVHTTQALVSTRADMRVLIVFTTHVTAIFSGLMLLFLVPGIRDRVLLDVVGLTPELAAPVGSALELSVLLAVCMAVAGLARGLVIASRSTGVIAASSGMRVVAVAAVGALGVALGIENGAMIGVLALAAAFGVEGLMLGGQLLRMDRRRPRLFEAGSEEGGP